MTVDSNRVRPLANRLGRYAHIDALRAYAVLVVVVSHLWPDLAVPGGSGVTLFFAISGFVITLVTLKEFDRTGGFSVRGFYWRRCLKIIPPFVAIIAVPTLVYAVFRPVNWGRFLSQVFFFYNWTREPEGPGVLPGSGVTWSLAIEEQFYIAFALAWLWLVHRSGRPIRVLAYGAVVMSCLAITERFAFAFAGASWERSYYGTDTRLDSIGIGVLTAIVFYRKLANNLWRRVSAIFRSDWMLLAMIMLYLASVAVRNDMFRDTIRYTAQSAVACGLILYGMLRPNSPTRIRLAFEKVVSVRFVQVVGLSSYSLYLVHAPVFHLVSFVTGEFALAGLWALVVSFGAMGLAITAGYLSWRLIETPALRLKQLFSSERT